MITIAHPPTYLPERQYILQVIVGEFLGLPYRTRVEERADTRITLDGDASGKALLLAEGLFQLPEDRWLTPESLPRRTISSKLPGAGGSISSAGTLPRPGNTGKMPDWITIRRWSMRNSQDSVAVRVTNFRCLMCGRITPCACANAR
jgi:hypothetical protein